MPLNEADTWAKIATLTKIETGLIKKSLVFLAEKAAKTLDVYVYDLPSH
jgi:hypothetical protein